MVNLVQIPVFSAETPCVGSVCFQCPISIAGRVEWVTTTHPCTLLTVVFHTPGAMTRIAKLPPVAIGTAALMLNTVKLHHTGSSLLRLML